MTRRWLLPLLLLPGRASAHASEQGFVLLLPTDLYIAGGVASVIATVILIALVPPGAARALFRPVRVAPRLAGPGAPVAGGIGLAVFLWMVAEGVTGSQDPTHNAMPLMLWSGFWIFLLTAQGLFGDIWRRANPWVALWWLRRRSHARLHLPRRLGAWPAVAMLMVFAAFLLADPAPAAPERLARIAAVYWAVNMAGVMACGPRWLFRVEPLSVLAHAYAGMAPFGRRRGGIAIGLPGWRWIAAPRPATGMAVFLILALGIGTFDGLNETFWWFGLIGVNPLEFSGRSSVVGTSLAGLAAACLLLVAAFAATIKAGLILAESDLPLALAFRALAPSILPIALGYHVAHYLPTALVDGQYLGLQLNDPLGQGWNLLGLAGHRVTTGFFNTRDTVQVIWLSQAAAVVLGHMIAVLMAHVRALSLFGTHGKAAVSQIPLALFMVIYTLFGLWLLASPRGG